MLKYIKHIYTYYTRLHMWQYNSGSLFFTVVATFPLSTLSNLFVAMVSGCPLHRSPVNERNTFVFATPILNDKTYSPSWLGSCNSSGALFANHFFDVMGQWHKKFFSSFTCSINGEANYRSFNFGIIVSKGFNYVSNTFNKK